MNDHEDSPSESSTPPRNAAQRRTSRLAAQKEKQKAMAKAYRERLKQSPAYQARVSAAKEKARVMRRKAYEQQKEKRQAEKAALKADLVQTRQEARSAKDAALKKTLVPAAKVSPGEPRRRLATARGPQKTSASRVPETEQKPSAPPLPEKSAPVTLVKAATPTKTPASPWQASGQAIDRALMEKLADLKARRAHLSLVKRDEGEPS